MNFYSEYGEDRVIYERYPDFFNLPKFYVDVGCAHPKIGSNTAFLRDLGWQGLHIDGDEDWRPHWGPSFIHAIIHTEPEVEFTINPVHCLSRVESGAPVRVARRLSGILAEYSVDRIGFMSIDVEGQEFEVLKSMEGFPTLPPFIVSEYNTAGIGEDFRVRDYLIEKGYSVIHQTIANFIFYDKSRV